jgi:RNA polymerase sigma factor (sigma-70 family)
VRRLLLRLLASAPPAGDHVPDAELLRRFAASGDPAAFELLVRRHAGAVWAAAFRVLRNETDAEDAFQAAFLALLRRSKQVRSASVGGWLHRVAVHAALKLRERSARAAPTEPAQLDAIPAPLAEPPDAEAAAVVHEELARLPERDRLPVVLCDLEGMSHAEAAKALGWPVGTVSGRLSRARAKLRARLARRGLTPAGGLVPALAIPPQLIPKALSLTAGAPPAVVTLAEGVLAMNATASWKWVAAAAVCAGALGTGGAFAVGLGGGGAEPPAVGGALTPPPEKPAPKEAGPDGEGWLPQPGSDRRFPRATKAPRTAFPEVALPEPAGQGTDARVEQLTRRCPRLAGKTPVEVAPTDDTLRKLLKARLHQGALELQSLLEVLRIGNWGQAQWVEMCELLADMRAAATELWAGQPKELVPWLEELVLVAKEMERYAQLRAEAGANPPQDVNAARRYRLAAEAALWKAKNAK